MRGYPESSLPVGKVGSGAGMVIEQQNIDV